MALAGWEAGAKGRQRRHAGGRLGHKAGSVVWQDGRLGHKAGCISLLCGVTLLAIIYSLKPYIARDIP